MTRRSLEQAAAVLDEVLAAFGYDDDNVETWEAGHGLMGMMVRSPECNVRRAVHLGRKIELGCNCLGPVTAIGRMHCVVLLASMVKRPDGLPEVLGHKTVMGWNHVTTWTPHEMGIPLARDVR